MTNNNRTNRKNKKNNTINSNEVEKNLVENYDIEPENVDDKEQFSENETEKDFKKSRSIKEVAGSIKNNFRTAKEFFKKTYNKKIIYMYILDAFIVTMMIEMLARHSVIKGIYYFIEYPYTIICNAMIILMTLSITLLMRRRIFGMCIINILWLSAGVANSVLLVCRVTPFNAQDIKQIDSAFGVIDKYFSWKAIVGVIVLVFVFVAILAYIWIRIPKVDHKINIPRNIGAIALIYVICMASLNMGIGAGLLSLKIGNLRDGYSQYGFVYCFVNSLINTGIKKPTNYSSKTSEIKKEVDEKVEDEDKEEQSKCPNIIFLQLESFFDVNHMKDLTFSENPVPFFTEMKENYPHGFLNVPIVGAGTVNTEFEAMTGMNLDDFGPGEYPFKTAVADRTCESICFNLKDYGYSCHAVHNNTATFYGRNKVFANLGYDTFTSIENINIPVGDKTQMGWAKDKYLTNCIMKALKSTKTKDFIYTISVQGHGSYPSEPVDYDITVDGITDESRKYSFEYYIKQINEMDQFLVDLTDKLSNYKEDVILVLYGDHLPSLGIAEDELDNGDVYQTEYIIWSNYKTDYENEDIECYELQAKILEKLNMTSGYINNYSQEHRKDEDQESYLEGLKNLAYDMLYGDCLLYNGENPYVATDIQFGLNKVVMTSISKMSESDSTVFIYGKNFTNYSKVFVNGEKFSTKFVDSSVLTINYEGLKNGDVFEIRQQNSDKNVLNVTESFVYQSETEFGDEVIEGLADFDSIVGAGEKVTKESNKNNKQEETTTK